MGGIRSLLAPATLVLLPLAAAATVPDPVARYPLLVALLVPATVGWLWAVRVAHGDESGDRARWGLVLAVAAALRLAWLLPEAPLSDDLYRYLWDGRVANAGIHPFAHAPSAPELSALRDGDVWPRINHPDIPTIYPPVAQLFFRVLDVVAPTARGARASAALVDLATVLLLALLVRSHRKRRALAVVAGWCPLSVMESAGGGHVDVVGAMLLVAGLLAWERGARLPAAVSGALLALSGMVKPTPVLALPAFLRAGAWPARRALLLGALAAALVAVPYLAAGTRLFTGLRAYAEHWRFNDSLYSLLVAAGASPQGARAALAVTVAAIAVVLPFRLRDPLAATACAIAAGITLSPTVHPWYALWMVPLLPFLPRAVTPAGYALVALLPLSYAASWTEAVTGHWAEPAWLRPAVWLPVLAALVWGALWRRRR